MTRPWAVIQHVPYERPGSIADEASELGLDLRTVHSYRGEELPRADEISGLIVMGGPMSVTDSERLPYLTDEADLLREAITAALPVLGVCLGAQLIASALGATVFKGPEEEIGPGTVRLTSEGLADPVLALGGPTIPVFHWHGETFELPDGCRSLAETDLYPNQAFRVGRSVLALQFHLELTPALLDAWRPELPEGCELSHHDLVQVEATGRALINRFLAATLSQSTDIPT